jgi:hypothetical protein
MAPPLLLERPVGAQIALAVGGALVLGIICGVLAMVNETAYVVVSLAAILGGIGAGYEHPTGDEGAIRGFCGGLVFGSAIVATVAVMSGDVEANLPHPHGFLIVVTTVLGVIFGMIGGLLRHRHEKRMAAATRRPAGRAA